MRLIDADALLKQLLEAKDDEIIKAVIGLVQTQPTAYDVEEVVAELEEQENIAILKAPNTSDIYNPNYQKWMMKSYGFKEAIDIVKRGGVE